jgi:hypothetical protein
VCVYVHVCVCAYACVCVCIYTYLQHKLEAAGSVADGAVARVEVKTSEAAVLQKQVLVLSVILSRVFEKCIL